MPRADMDVVHDQRPPDLCASQRLANANTNTIATINNFLRSIGELNAIANSEIDVEIGRVGDRLIAVEKGHVAEIDFPIEMARGARIVGVIRRSALGKCRRQEREEDEAPQPSDRAKH